METGDQVSAGSGNRFAGLRKYAKIALRLLFGAVFVYAGTLKALNAPSFAADISRYHILPEFAVTPLAYFLPFFEIFSGLAVASGVLLSSGLVATLSLLGIFIAALISAWFRGLDIQCGCFGQGGGASVQFALLRNLVLLAVGAALCIVYRNQLANRF
jgi:uncharacterized membrane protein YphA (DoxX/SURF4 family)